MDESAHLVTALEPTSELRAPAWVAPAHVFRGATFPGGARESDDDVFNLPHLALVIDLRCLNKPSAASPRVDQQGWAVLPLFGGAGYVASGVYRLPLYQTPTGGEPSPALLEHIATDGARGVLAKACGDRRVRLVEGASVDVALLDELRTGEWDGSALPEIDASALNEAVGGNGRARDKYAPHRSSKAASTVFSATVTEAAVRAKFENALGFAGR
jgi:hypothetical protein